MRDRLNGYFRLKAGVTRDIAVYLDGNKMDPISFNFNAITPLLINVEEERTLRNPNRFQGVIKDGMRIGPNPEVRISLLLLFVARFEHYDESMKFLSLLIRFFQSNYIFDVSNTPGLDPEIEQLQVEIQTMPIGEQNELWNALRTTYLPSVAYKVSMLVFRDEENLESLSGVSGINRNLSDPVLREQNEAQEGGDQ